MLSIGTGRDYIKKELDTNKGGGLEWATRLNSLMYEVEMSSNKFFTMHFM